MCHGYHHQEQCSIQQQRHAGNQSGQPVDEDHKQNNQSNADGTSHQGSGKASFTQGGADALHLYVLQREGQLTGGNDISQIGSILGIRSVSKGNNRAVAVDAGVLIFRGNLRGGNGGAIQIDANVVRAGILSCGILGDLCKLLLALGGELQNHVPSLVAGGIHGAVLGLCGLNDIAIGHQPGACIGIIIRCTELHHSSGTDLAGSLLGVADIRDVHHDLVTALLCNRCLGVAQGVQALTKHGNGTADSGFYIGVAGSIRNVCLIGDLSAAHQVKAQGDTVFHAWDLCKAQIQTERCGKRQQHDQRDHDHIGNDTLFHVVSVPPILFAQSGFIISSF